MSSPMYYYWLLSKLFCPTFLTCSEVDKRDRSCLRRQPPPFFGPHASKQPATSLKMYIRKGDIEMVKKREKSISDQSPPPYSLFLPPPIILDSGGIIENAMWTN